ncbi:MAG: T9SS type A sorting domain-containing protein [Crocinitomicaceae bacterium]|nr:T9SS type A sorting domain-containing protein [Crocinitomicaceae bacterium]
MKNGIRFWSTFLVLLGTVNVSYCQSVQKSTITSFQSVSPNDSLIVVAGQSMSGESLSPQILHGYLPLQYSQLSVPENTPVGLSLYPNPVQSVLYVTTSAAVIKELYLYDISGKKIRVEWVDSENYSLTLEGISDGIYIVEVLLTDGRSFREKIIKN